jgi:hypothetical protein
MDSGLLATLGPGMTQIERESKKVRALSALGANQSHQGSVPQFVRRESNKQMKKESRRIKEMAAPRGFS